jgi:hypothetical protein
LSTYLKLKRPEHRSSTKTRIAQAAGYTIRAVTGVADLEPLAKAKPTPAPPPA